MTIGENTTRGKRHLPSGEISTFGSDRELQNRITLGYTARA